MQIIFSLSETVENQQEWRKHFDSHRVAVATSSSQTHLHSHYHRAETGLDSSDTQRYANISGASRTPRSQLFFPATLEDHFSLVAHLPSSSSHISKHHWLYPMACVPNSQNTACVRTHVLTCSNSLRLCICTGGPFSVSSHEKSAQMKK